MAGAEAGSGGVHELAGMGGAAGDGGAGLAGQGGECEAQELRCDVYQPQHCVAGRWENDGSSCPLACVDGECQDPRSCSIAGGVTPCVDGVSCCETIWVPGGTYTMGRHSEEPTLPFARTVSGFYLDRFEVTVGRMRAFTADYRLPNEGGGAHPRIPGSGWHEAWEELPHPDPDLGGITSVPKTFEELIDQMSTLCPEERRTWNNGALLPANCVNWYVAFAFCAWDGGRLPTEAEWNYAAAYGAAERPYPWSVDETDFAISEVHLAFADALEPPTRPLEVGTHPAGRGGFFRYPGRGHDDLAGNVAEWTLDSWSDSPAESCSDCFEPWSDVPERVTRGGSFGNYSDQQLTGNRASADAADGGFVFGFRCARDMYNHPE
ncbi:MAG TPA: SUMF1/EgtB/PvdO family nonheme iron enzyme [Polyangiaceae bacterium]